MAVYAKRATVALALGAATTYFQHCSHECKEDMKTLKGAPHDLKGAWSDLVAAHDEETNEVSKKKYKDLIDAFETCNWANFTRSKKTFAHRGDALNRAEHTIGAYRAAADQGTMWLECDMTRTSGVEFVCRHATNDLATTTNIVESRFDWVQNRCTNSTTTAGKPSYKCSTSNFDVAELRELTAMMDSSENPDWNLANKANMSYLHHQRKYRSSFRAFQGMPDDVKIVTLEEYLEFAVKNGMNVAPEIKDTHVHAWTTAKEIVTLNMARIAAFMRNDSNGAANAWTGNNSIILQTFDWRVAKHLTSNASQDRQFEYRVQYMWEEIPPTGGCAKNNNSAAVHVAEGWAFDPQECCFTKPGGEVVKKDCGHENILKYLLDTDSDHKKVDIFAPPIQRWITSDGNEHLKFKKAPTGTMLMRMKELTNSTDLKFGTFSFEREGCFEQEDKTKTYLTLGPCRVPNKLNNLNEDFYYKGISGISAKRNADTLFIMKWLFDNYGKDFIGAFSDYPFTLAALDHCVLREDEYQGPESDRLRRLI